MEVVPFFFPMEVDGILEDYCPPLPAGKWEWLTMKQPGQTEDLSLRPHLPGAILGGFHFFEPLGLSLPLCGACSGASSSSGARQS